jgi:predicted TPR repeat methyltransferase
LTPEEEIIRAERCKQILGDKYVKEALGEIREAIVTQWAKAPIKDGEFQGKMHALYNAVDKFEELLRIHVESGKIASHELERKRSFKDWLR